jgi:hypothetical protein
MDFRKFRDININVKNVDIKINSSVWDKQPALYNNSVTIDGASHKINVVRCGYLGLIFLLIDGQPTVQLYGTKKTISENLNSLDLTDDVRQKIQSFAEYND